jgi:iron complex outermembrane recepter protein
MRKSERRLVLGLTGLLLTSTLLTSVAVAQAPVIEEIIVTGTRRVDRTVASSPVPIDVIPTAELMKSGFGEVNKILNNLVPSFNFPQPTITDGTDHIRPATLRGLGPDHVLVLVNGKRRHNTALLNLNGSVGRGSTGADLNSIPAAAIKRIEILRDGAAAQYGSDAIAGVMNIILKSDDSGGSFSGSIGQYYEGDGRLVHTMGNVGVGIGEAGFLNLTGEFRDRGHTNRQAADTRQQYANVAGAPNPKEATINRRDNFWYGDSEVEDYNLFYNAGLPVGDGLELYSFGNYGQRTGKAGATWRRPQDGNNIRTLFPDGFLPFITSKIDDLSLAVGLKGDSNGISWDVSSVYGRNFFPFGVENTVNATYGLETRTKFKAGDLTYSQWVSNADGRTEADIGLPAPVSVAFGLEYRYEEFAIGAGEFDSYGNGGRRVLDTGGLTAIGGQPALGAQGFPGFPFNIDSDRNSASAYIDLETNLTDKLLTSFAGRVEHYSDFGWTASGKFAFKYDFVDAFGLRGAISNGFRAPSLAQSFYTTTSTNFIGGVPFEIRTFQVSDPVAVALGAEPLDPETSINYSLGFVSKPLPGATLTVDAYQIEITDRIVMSENLTGTAVQNFLQARGFFGVTGGRFFTNAIDTRTRGVDIVGAYSFDLDNDATLRLTAGINFNETDVTKVKPNPSTLSAVGLNLTRFARVEDGRFTVAQPSDKVNLSATYTLGGLDVTGRATRYGEFTSRNANAALDQTFGAEWVFDLELSYDITESLTLSVGANNITDEYPDTAIPGANPNGFAQYSNFSPFGFNGGFYYSRVNLRW